MKQWLIIWIGCLSIVLSCVCVRGAILSDWTLSGKAFELKVTIPPNAAATVRIPVTAAPSFSVDGSAVASSAAARFFKLEDGVAVFEVTSGSYTFGSTVR